MSTVEFTSDVVRKKKFRDKLRGYHPEEVDAFITDALDEVRRKDSGLRAQGSGQGEAAETVAIRERA